MSMLYKSQFLKANAGAILQNAMNAGTNVLHGTQSLLHNVVGQNQPAVSLAQLQAQLQKGELLLQDDAVQYCVRMTLDRDYLNTPYYDVSFPQPGWDLKEPKGWVRLTRLPISPLEEKTYALYPRWQNAIATIHALNHKLCYVLLRSGGETKIFLGIMGSSSDDIKDDELRMRLGQAVSSQMPGIGIEFLEETKVFNELSALNSMTRCGAVTGIPSIRKITEYGEYQTMDQIAMGLRKPCKDGSAEEIDFAVVIVAEPVPDNVIVDTLRSMENLGSEIHELTKHTGTVSRSTGATISVADTNGDSVGLSVGAGLGTIINAHIDANIGTFVSRTNVTGANSGSSETISTEYINQSALYCEEVLGKHMTRLKAGRNLGFWKTGVYVLAEAQSTVQTVMGMLRAVYSGDDSYIEPIRTLSMPSDSGAHVLVRMFRHIPYPRPSISSVLGKIYEDYATPMTTEELSIATSLPRRDVPGLRLIRNASRFATNPPAIKAEDAACLGEVLDTGAPTHQSYCLNMNHFVKHTLVAGANGSGKTHTCRRILSQLRKKNIPFLVIEPTKDEYLDWALAENEKAGKRTIRVFAPGLHDTSGKIEQLHLNPFQPAAVPGSDINMLGHLDRLKAALIGSMPMSDVLPLIMEETIYTHVKDKMYVKSYQHDTSANGNPLDWPFRDDGKIKYPLVEGMDRTARSIVEGRQYDNDVEKNISAAIQTRVSSLLLGWKKTLFNTERSTDFSTLFDSEDVVINLSHLTDDRDKAFVMSLLLIALWEYRESKFHNDLAYKKRASENSLMHLTLIEESHRLMPNSALDGSEENRAQGNVARMFSNMLSEIRAYGEGCIVVDQIPTRLIPDAIKNTNLKIVHRLTSMDDIKAVSAGMLLREDQQAVIGMLQPGEAIVCSEYDDAAAWVKIAID